MQESSYKSSRQTSRILSTQERLRHIHTSGYAHASVNMNTLFSVFLSVSLVFMIASVCSQSVASPTCSPSDAIILREFYKVVGNTSSLSWPIHSNCCSWIGIVCDIDGHVVSMHLPSFNLSGLIPSILFNLSALESLNVSRNLLSGRILQNAGNLSRLTMLDLSYNPYLTGPFPASLPDSLQWLDISHCALDGSLPENISNSSRLSALFINHNFFSSFASSSMLSWESLQVLDASSNVFSGSFPEGLLNCSKLRHLNFDGNQVGGLLPLELGGLKDLETLRLQGNRFTGPIPHELGKCTQLRQLWLDNNALNGTIPKTFGQLSLLTGLSLANNRLEGPFPRAIIKCARLSFLSLSGNNLSGDVPAALGSLRHLKVLLLGSNHFSGVVSLDKMFLNQLQVFDASNNKLEAWEMDKVLQLTEARTSSPNQVFGADYPQSLHAHVRGSLSSEMSFAARPLPCSIISNPQFSSSLLHHALNQHRRQLQSKEGLSGDSKHSVLLTIGVLAGVGVFCSVLFVVGMLIICRRMSRRERGRGVPPRLSSLRKFRRESSRVFDPTLTSISMRDLVKATDGFDCRRVIGDGGFGLVYCATLQDGRTVAVKKLSTDGMQGKREFEAEMETLGKIKHANLVELLAYCKLGEDRVLVYAFVDNGSLDTWLHERVDGPALLIWERRVKIACGSAHGLAYLHYDCNPHVLHRDIKSSNILLGTDFEPKIADFGLARTMSPQYSHVSTEVAGTIGYMAPEFTLTLSATKEADVYSFGMVMLELASGRRPNLLLQENSFRKLAQWARHMLHLGREMDVLDPVLRRKPPPADQVRAYFAVACDCVIERPKERPTMREIHKRLSLIGLEEPE